MRTNLIQRIQSPHSSHWKLAFLAAAWLMLFGLIAAACGPAPKPVTATPAAKPTQTATLAALKRPTQTKAAKATPAGLKVDVAKLRGIRIHFSYAWAGDVADTVEKLVAEFNATNTWGIWVSPTRTNSYTELYTTTLSLVGKPLQPDAIVGSMEQALAWNSDQDLVVDLTPYLQDPKVGLSSKEIADFVPGAWEGDSWNGAQLGIPAQRSIPLLAYNQSWASDLGFSSPPLTLNAFKDQTCAAEKSLLKDGISENNGTGGWLIDSSADTAAAWLLAFDSQFIPAKPAAPYQFETAQSEAAFQYLRGLFDTSCVWLGRNPDPGAYFIGRQALLITLQSEDLPGLAGELATAGSKDRWMVLPFPTQDGKPRMMAAGPSYRVLRSTPERELAAWLFIRWLSDPAQQARLVAAGSWLPLRASTYQQMSSYAAQHPQWKQAADLIAGAQSAPTLASWQTARPVLDDAFNQLFAADTKASQIPDLLKQLDQTVQEVLERGP